MLKKPFNECIGKKLICPNCYTDLLNGNIKLRRLFLSEKLGTIKTINGIFSDTDYYDFNELKQMYEDEFYCMACGYELTKFFKYINCLNNTSDREFSDKVINFICDLNNVF